MNKILVVNAGSSSIKWKLFSKEGFDVIAEGMAERIFVDGKMQIKYEGKKTERNANLISHKEATEEIFKDLNDLGIIKDKKEISNIGFRIVQGGNKFTSTTLLKDKEIQEVDELKKLAPLHNGPAAITIRAFQELFPHAILSGTFDTAFHSTIPKINAAYPINQKLAKELKIKKYGAHGTSHKYIGYIMEKELNKDKVSIISMHIGGGASLCAIKDSISFDTSMGLTPLAGVMMGTRSGDIDPSIHQFICQETGKSIVEVTKMLNHDSGLKGVSGISEDLRDIISASDNGDENAIFAIELYVQKIVDYLAKYINKLAKVDALVFTAGVGENSPLIREKIIQGINIKKLGIDKKLNNGKIGDVSLISNSESEIPVYVVRTDEEFMIAKESQEV